MRTINAIEEARQYCKEAKAEGKTIATINTGGHLHHGHMSLVKLAKEKADITIMMIDFPVEFMTFKESRLKKFEKKYMNNIMDKDIQISKEHGVDMFFFPPPRDLYKRGMTQINISNPYVEILKKEGEYFTEKYIELLVSPHHMLSFLKDYNILSTDFTLLGQKDIYQTMSVVHMLKDFNLQVKPLIAPTVRDSDGLPSSSHNQSLSVAQRKRASNICEKLQDILEWPKGSSCQDIKNYLTRHLKNSRSQMDFVAVHNFETGESLDVLDRDALVVVAGIFGDLHLIDNIMVKPK